MAKVTTRSGVMRREQMRVRLLLALAVAAQVLAFAVSAHAQRPVDFGLTYVQERDKFVGSGSSDFFYLRGASADVGVSLWHGLGVSAKATGVAALNLRGSIDVEQISFAGGPRYTFNLGHITPTTWGRRGGAFVEAQAGYIIATSGLFPSGGTLVGNASGALYQGGGGINLNIYHRFDLRLIEVDYVHTTLPNGGSNQQNNLRASAGINFHFGN